MTQRSDLHFSENTAPWRGGQRRRGATPLMTYVIMPRVTRLFAFWLYPDRK